MSKSISLGIHYKQGDDLESHVRAADGNTVQGLRNWADQLEAGVRSIRAVADRLEGVPVELTADVHFISFLVPDDVAKDLLKIEGTDVDLLAELDDDDYGDEVDHDRLSSALSQAEEDILDVDFDDPSIGDNFVLGQE